MQFVFIACRVKDYRNLLKLICRPVALTSYKAFEKKTTKRGLEPVSLSHFLNYFLRKVFILLYSINLTTFHCLVAFTS